MNSSSSTCVMPPCSGERCLRTILEQLPDAYYLTDLEGVFLDANRMAEKISGYQRAELLGKNFAGSGLLSRDQLPRAIALRQRNAAGMCTGPDEFTLTRRDGSTVEVEIVTRPVELDGRTLIVGSVRDISPRKRAAAAARKSEQRYRTLFEHANDGILLMHGGRFVECNRKALEILRRTADEIIGKTPEELSPERQPDGQSSAAKARFLLAEIHREKRLSFEWIHIRGDGSEIYVEVGLSEVEVGSECIVMCIWRDLTERKEIEERIRLGAHRYQALVENIPGAVYRGEARYPWRIEHVTENIFEISGYPRSNFLGPSQKPYADLVHPDDLERLEMATEQSLKTGQPYSIEYRIVHAGGTIRWIMDRGQTLPGGSDDSPVVEGIILDITEQKQMEQTLRESEESLRLAQQVACFGDWSYDMATRQLRWSETACRIHGLPPSATPAFRDVMERFHPDDLARVEEAWSEALETGRFDVVARVMTDGETRWVHLRGGIAPGTVDSPKRLIGVTQDISQHKRAEERIRTSHERISAILDATNEGIWEWDVKTNKGELNARYFAMLGYEPGELAKNNSDAWLNLIHPDDLESTRRALSAYLAKPVGYYESRFRMRHKNGDDVWILSRGRAVSFDSDGKPLRMVGSHTDISTMLRLERQIGEAQRMESIGRLAGGIAHDFNNLLTLINGYSDLLVSQLTSNPVLEKYAGEIHRAGQSAAQLTRQLLAVGRRQLVKPEKIGLNEFLRGMQSMLERLIREDISLIFHLHPEECYVTMDPGQLQQIVLNLVVNGRDAMPEGGKLIILTSLEELPRVAEAGDSLGGLFAVLKVSDTGVGMTEETRERVFEPFFTTKPAGSGAGLGLATVYGIVEQAGGRIYVDTELGKGSVFSIYLPRTNKPLAAGRAMPEYNSCHESLQGRETVLFVEDVEQIRALMVQRLSELGYRVLAASGGEEAMEIAEKGAGGIDVLVTDMVMPGMSGKELALRLVARSPELPILFITGYSDDVVGPLAPELAGATILQKPVSPDHLAREIRSVLARSCSRQA